MFTLFPYTSNLRNKCKVADSFSFKKKKEMAIKPITMKDLDSHSRRMKFVLHLSYMTYDKENYRFFFFCRFIASFSIKA